MIVGEYLQKVFHGIKLHHKVKKNDIITDVISDVNCEYGDELALVRWVTAKNVGINKIKYPLIWVSDSNYTEHAGFLTAKVRFILLSSTKYDWLNNARYEEKFKHTLRPLADLVEDTLKKSLTINVIGSGTSRFTRCDEPLWSVSGGKFQRPNNGSATTDIMDAITIDCTLEININCLKI